MNQDAKRAVNYTSPVFRNRYGRFRRSAIAGLLAMPAFAAGAAELTGLGDPPGGAFYSFATAVSANGNVVVGEGLTADATGAVTDAFIWSPSGGLESLGIRASSATGVSANGDVVVGYFHNGDHTEAFRWTSGGGLQALGTGGLLSTLALAVSGDGNTVVGQARGAGQQQAFLWREADGIVLLGHLAGGAVSSLATGVSQDGSVVVGVDRMAAGGMQAFRYTSADGMTGIGYLAAGQNYSRANAISADGMIIVGEASNAAGQVEAMRWSAGDGMSGLGFLSGHDFSYALATSSDGQVVVGSSVIEGDGTSARAFRWTAIAGMQDLGALLTSSGVALGAWKLHVAHGVDADGNVVVGEGTNPDGNTEAFIARLDGLLIGVDDFSSSLASLSELDRVPREVARVNSVNGIPGATGPYGISVTPHYLYIRGSRSELAGAAATWRQPGYTLSAQIGAVDARETGLYRNSQADYRGGWMAAATSVALGDLLRTQALRPLEVDTVMQYGRLNTAIDRNYLNGASPETAHGDTKTSVTDLLLRVSWRQALSDSLSVAPYLQMTDSHIRIAAYGETGGAMAGTVSGHTVHSRENGAGISAAWRPVRDLTLRARYGFSRLNHDDDASPILTVASMGTFEIPRVEYDRSWHELDFAAEWAISEDIGLGLKYGATNGSNYPERWSAAVSLGVRL